MRLRTAKPSTHLHLSITPTAHHYRRLASFTVPLASTEMLIFFFVLLRPTWPRPPSRVHAPPCSPRLASRVTTVCIENPDPQAKSVIPPTSAAKCGCLRSMPEQVTQLGRRDRHQAIRRRRPQKATVFQTLREQARALPVVPDHLQQVAAASAEAEQMSAQRVAAQHLLHLERQARKALPHVGVPRGQPDPYAGRNGDHRRRLVLASALSSADTVDASTDLHPTAGRELDLDRARLLRRRHWQRWSCCLRHGRNCYRAERDGRRRTFAALAATGTAAWHVSRLRAQPPRPPHPAPVPPR